MEDSHGEVCSEEAEPEGGVLGTFQTPGRRNGWKGVREKDEK